VSTESFPNPDDPAEVQRFLDATSAFLAATAASEQAMLTHESATEAKEILVGDSVIAAMRQQGVANFPPGVSHLSNEGERGEYTEEQLNTIRRGAGLAGGIVQLQYGGATSDVGAIRRLVGETMAFLEDPKEIRAWLGVLKKALQPHVNLDEILGPEPEATTRQLVEEYEERLRQDEHRRTAKRKRREVATTLIEKIFEDFGEHDDVVDLRREMIALCIVKDDDLAHLITTRAALLGVAESGKKIDPTNPNFSSTMRDVINTIRARIFGLPPIEEYLPPGWEPRIDDEDE
jgi:hypothetical protein